MGNMKEKLQEMVAEAQEAMECYPDERIEASYLDAVESAGETPEWVIHCGNIVIADGFQTEREAEDVLDMLLGELELEDGEKLPEVNPNGSLLNPDVVTYCTACHEHVDSEVSFCPTCGSGNVEHIRE